MKTVAMMNAVSNMDHSKPTWKVSWLRRWRLLLVTFCLLDLSNGIQFWKSPSKASYSQRNDLDLVCSDTKYPKIVTISKRGGEILLNKTSPTKKWTFTATHRINNIQCNQMGFYECEVLHYNGTKTSDTLDVPVDYCAQLRVSPQGDIIKPGDDVSMTCIGVNYPNMLAISKRGEHDRFNLSSKSSRQFILDVRHQINNIKCEQMGVYECRGLFHGDKSHESVLNVGNSSYCKTLTSASKTEDAQPTDNKDCEEGWKFYSNTCVKGYGSEEKMTWTSANNKCKDQKSQLIGEKAAEIVAFLNDVLDVNAIWINERKRNKCTVQVKSNNGNKAIECNKFHAFVCFKPADGSVTTDMTKTSASATIDETPTRAITTTTSETSTVISTITTTKAEAPTTTTVMAPPETTTKPTTTLASTTSRKTTTVTPTTTALKPECPQMDLSKCPGGWFPIRDKTCMKVEKARKYYNAATTSCRNYGGSLLDKNIDDVTKACILAQLPDDTNYVWLSSWHYLDVQTKESETYRGDSPRYYACSIQNYVPLSIPYFNMSVSLEGLDGQRTQNINIKLHNFSQSYEEVKKGNVFIFQCEARGTPVPDLSVFKDGEEVRKALQQQIINTTAVAITYNTKADRCGELGTFSCNASNVFGNLSSYGNVQIRVPCPTKIITFETTPRQQVLDRKAEIKCITESYPWPDITLYRNDTGEKLAYISTFNKSQQLVYTIEKVKCSDMGLYECVAKGSGDPQRKISQLAVYSCPPRLCPGKDQKKTISAAVGETKTVSFCAISFPGLRQVLLNGTSSQNHRKFDVHYNRTDRSSLYYTIYVTIKNITQGDYGTLRIEMETNYSIKATHQVQIQTKGPPNCPTGLQLLGNGSDYVTLSWQPGFNGGAVQTFNVFYAHVDGSWEKFSEDVSGGQGTRIVNVTGLTADSEYSFRVISFNKFTKKSRDEKLCNNTINGKTAQTDSTDLKRQDITAKEKKDSSGKEDGPGSLIIGLVLGITIVLMVFSGLAGFMVYKRRRNQGGARPLNPRASDTSDEDDGRANVYANVKPGASASGDSAQQSGATQMEALGEGNTYSNVKSAASPVGASGESESQLNGSKAGAKEEENVVVFGLGDENSGRYLSDEGLIYVTVAETKGPRRPWKRKPQREQDDDPVEYVSLDYTKTGQFLAEEEVVGEKAQDGESGQDAEKAKQ